MRHQSGDTVAGADMGGLPQYTSIQPKHLNTPQYTSIQPGHLNTARASQYSQGIPQDPIRPNTATTNKQTAISTTAPATLDLERLFFLQDTSVLLPVLNTSSISINHYILSISITDKQRTQSLLKEQRAEFYII